MLKSFPKIFALGTTYISDIFNDEVEVTEKVDGSQFVFGIFDGDLQMRSKGTVIHDYHARAETDLFYPAIQHAMSVEAVLPNNVAFYCETLCKPKHNTLKYNRVPRNNLVLYGVSTLADEFINSHDALAGYAELLGIDVVPLVYQGRIGDATAIHDLMHRESYLGGTDIEGLVVKNYKNAFLLGGQPIAVMAGKYVSEQFKEVHRKTWSGNNTTGGKWALFKENYRTEARWAKAVQHLKEAGRLEGTPRDIGQLIVEVREDIVEEEMEAIKDFLFKQFGDELMRRSTVGLPEWYKNKLLEDSFVTVDSVTAD